MIETLSRQHDAPIKRWLQEGHTFKFVGDNLDRSVVVRDIRSDHHGGIVHMFSLLAVKDRVKPPPSNPSFNAERLLVPPTFSSLVTAADVASLRQNLVVLVSRELCKYITCLQHCSSSVCRHIVHIYSREMASKSEVAVIDVLHLNETKNSDLLQIMKEMVKYLGAEFPDTVLSGGDQLTTERETCCKRHVMDGNTRVERLEQLEPCTEDWHALMCMLEVS